MEEILQEVTEGLKHYEYGIEFGKMDNYGMPPALEKEMYALFTRLNKPQKNLLALIADIKKYVAKYPYILPFKNYLYGAYMQAGERDKADELNDKMLAEHPDYLFAIVNKAASYYLRKEYDKIPSVLGTMLEIGELQPQRKTFHVTEYLGFNKIVVLYACAIDNIELAKNRLELMQKIAPDMADTEFAREAVEDCEYISGWTNKLGDLTGSDDYNEIDEEYLSLPQTTEKPVFNHPEIEQLYEFSLRIDAGLLHQILSLPRATLVQDLQEVIYDSIRRYECYSDCEWVEEEHNFLLHAIILLAEMRAVESLPVLLEILKQGEDYLDYWFGDMLTEDLWEIYYQVFDLQAYMEYLRGPRYYSFAKNMIANVIFRKAEAEELSREGAVSVYKELLGYFIDNRANPDILSEDITGGLITDICNLNLATLLPEIKACFDYEIAGEWVCGNYESIERDIRIAVKHKKRGSILATGFENFYDALLHGLIFYKENKDIKDVEMKEDKNDSLDFLKDENPTTPDLVAAPKKNTVGRNDPCPCGSGKKFKKCCLN